MDRRLPIVAALVVLASLAGCSALLGGDGATPAATPDGATPNGDAAPATPATSTPADSSTATTPTRPAEGTQRGTPTTTATPATADSRTFDAGAVQDAHVDGLRTAGSFQRSSALVIRNESTTRYINGSYALETDGPVINTANITYVTDRGTRNYPVTTRYTAGETTYVRRFEDNGTTYDKGTEPYNETDPDPVDERVAYRIGRIAFDVIDASAWTLTGTGTIDGTNVTRYDTGPDGFDAAGYPNARGNATLVVGEDGVVRYVAYRFVATPDGERTEYIYEAGYTGIGATSVEQPAWTENA